MTVQERIFHLSVDKQSLEKHLSCAVKYLVRHGISTGLSNIDWPKIPVSGKLSLAIFSLKFLKGGHFSLKLLVSLHPASPFITFIYSFEMPIVLTVLSLYQHGGKSKGTTCVVDRDVTAYMSVDRVLRFPTE